MSIHIKLIKNNLVNSNCYVISRARDPELNVYRYDKVSRSSGN